MHLQPVLRKRGLFQDVSLPHCENLAERGFYIPSGLGLTDETIEEVGERVEKALS